MFLGVGNSSTSFVTLKIENKKEGIYCGGF